MTKRKSALPGDLGEQTLGTPLMAPAQQEQLMAEIKALAAVLGQDGAQHTPPSSMQPDQQTDQQPDQA